MKKGILASLIGVAAVTNAFGQGAILFDTANQGTYNQVLWGFGPNIGQPPYNGTPDYPMHIQLYYAEGTGYTSLDQLTPGITTPYLNDGDGAGATPGGYFWWNVQYLPTWQPGDVFTFCTVVTEPGYAGQSAFWTEQAAIHNASGALSGFLNFPGMFIVPEPSSFALLGVGIATFAAVRRRSRRDAF